MERLITEKTVQSIIGKRNKQIHKGDCGRVLIAAGSPGMAGAAILAAQSALRAGSGLVRTAIPAALFPIVQVAVPEATCVQRALPIHSLADFDAICVGPGLGQEKEGIDFVRELLISYENTLIVDADGLNIIAHNDFFELLRRRAERCPERTILTPHMGEAARLLASCGGALQSAAPARKMPQNLGTSLAAACGPASPAGTPLVARTCAARLAPAEEPASRKPGALAPEPPAFDFSGGASAADRAAIAAALVQKTGAIIVLKGAGTLVAAPGRETFTNTTGNPGMATAGAGDALSGIITSLAGQRSQVGTNFAAAPEQESQTLGRPAAPARGACAQPFGTNFAADRAPKPQRTSLASASGADLQIGTNLAAAPEQKPGAPARIGAFEAAIAGVYIHGLAGDLAAAELGEYGITAGDIALYTAYAIKKILQEAAGEV